MWFWDKDNKLWVKCLNPLSGGLKDLKFWTERKLFLDLTTLFCVSLVVKQTSILVFSSVLSLSCFSESYSLIKYLTPFFLSLQNELRSELKEKTSLYESQLANVEKEKEVLKTYKQDEVQSFKVTSCTNRYRWQRSQRMQELDQSRYIKIHFGFEAKGNKTKEILTGIFERIISFVLFL